MLIWIFLIFKRGFSASLFQVNSLPARQLQSNITLYEKIIELNGLPKSVESEERKRGADHISGDTFHDGL